MIRHIYFIRIILKLDNFVDRILLIKLLKVKLKLLSKYDLRLAKCFIKCGSSSLSAMFMAQYTFHHICFFVKKA